MTEKIRLLCIKRNIDGQLLTFLMYPNVISINYFYILSRKRKYISISNLILESLRENVFFNTTELGNKTFST